MARTRLFLYVTGGYLCVSTSNGVAYEPLVQPLNRSVLFLKDSDVVLSSDVWQVALNLNISTYEDVLSSIKPDWDVVSRHQEDSTTLS
jgi:hypothetical protein